MWYGSSLIVHLCSSFSGSSSEKVDCLIILQEVGKIKNDTTVSLAKKDLANAFIFVV